MDSTGRFKESNRCRRKSGPDRCRRGPYAQRGQIKHMVSCTRCRRMFVARLKPVPLSQRITATRYRPPSESDLFKRIRGLSFDKYCEAISRRSDSDYLDDQNNQCHVNAEIADKKFDRIKRAWLCMFWSIPPWLLVLLILYRGGQFWR